MRLKLFIIIFSFANLLVTPTFMAIHMGDEADLSFLMSQSEEENSEEKSISFSDYVVHENCNSTVLFVESSFSEDLHYTSSYRTIYQKVVSPPPDFRLNSNS